MILNYTQFDSAYLKFDIFKFIKLNSICFYPFFFDFFFKFFKLVVRLEFENFKQIKSNVLFFNILS